VVEESLWHAAQKAREDRRRTRPGRPQTGESPNPFSGLLRDALDGEKLHVCSSTAGPGYKYLVSAAAIQKAKGAKWRTFPLRPFVDAVLSMLKELAASSLFSDPGAERITVLQGRLGEVEKRLAVALEKFEADPESPTWSDRVSRYDREKRALVQELKEAELEAAHPLSASWAEAVSLMAADEPERLRAALLATVEGVWCVFVNRGSTRLAAVQVFFHGGACRDYLILHRGVTGGAVKVRPSQWWARSLASVAKPRELDLRRREDAASLEKVLLAVDVDKLAATLAE
jgi:hypothetical protein